ncbi:MAG: alpha/beta hydrolase [Rhodospirillaceae bacterium]|jgi:pimeloyl-ACP methyl ester carboxylesterase|nr:alpha/beta hydrolase [Rhodospirillaceae bacterium]MBT6137607.1 alpha/beta hydrolase [Rhodospirillaceae bacterium]
MTTFVLVHGAWHGGWCYARVREKLQAMGHTVFTPTMTGLCDRSHLLSPSVGLQTHILDVANLLAWENLSEVVLCGHSYGGMVITGAADREADRLKALVYLDAFVPSHGQAAFDLRAPERNAIALKKAREKGAGWLLPPTRAATFKVNAADQAWVDAKCTDIPLACFTQPLHLTGAYKGIARKVYLRAAGCEAPDFDRVLAECAADPKWITDSVDCGHDVMVDDPDWLVERLIEAGE